LLLAPICKDSPAKGHPALCWLLSGLYMQHQLYIKKNNNNVLYILNPWRIVSRSIYGLYNIIPAVWELCYFVIHFRSRLMMMATPPLEMWFITSRKKKVYKST
jgi:hypothetical protein